MPACTQTQGMVCCTCLVLDAVLVILHVGLNALLNLNTSHICVLQLLASTARRPHQPDCTAQCRPRCMHGHGPTAAAGARPCGTHGAADCTDGCTTHAWTWAWWYQQQWWWCADHGDRGQRGCCTTPHLHAGVCMAQAYDSNPPACMHALASHRSHPHSWLGPTACLVQRYKAVQKPMQYEQQTHLGLLQEPPQPTAPCPCSKLSANVNVNVHVHVHVPLSLSPLDIDHASCTCQSSP